MTRKTFLRALSGWALPVAAAESRSFDLEGDSFRLRLHGGADGLWLERIELTPGVLLPTSGSATALLPEGMPWQFSRVESAAQVSVHGSLLRVRDVLLGPADRPLAREDWELELRGREFRWRIRRRFLRDVKLLADRFPALVFHIVPGPRGVGEVPGFLDPAMQLDGTRGFVLRVGTSEWYEVVSPDRVQAIDLAPSGLRLESRLAAGLFSFAKTPSDGTVATLALGAESVDRRSGPAARRRGATQNQEWTLALGPNPGAAPFELSLPDAFLAGQARSFAAVHNQWMGWMIGNNPASVPILHEMGWYPMMQSIYAADEKSRRALEQQLAFFAASGVEPSGYVFPRWSVGGYYRVHWGNLHDQIPHFILAMYFHAVNTGSREFVRQVMPALDRVAAYLLSLDRDHDGVAEIPGTSGLADGQRDCSNWYDIIKFGHKDAYVNVYCCAALDAMAEMKAFAGDPSAAARYRAEHRRAVEAFNRVFWDGERGFYMDWIDVHGDGRRYFYTDPNLLAIIFGIAGASRSARILANLDRRYAELCRDFHLSRDALYATPCNMLPITRLGDMVQFGELQNQKVFPNYENGCSFFHTTGLEIAARAAAGQPDAAYDTFERVMRQGYARNRLWAAALKWDTGELISEPLNNALLILWGFLRGCFGVRPSLEKLEITGAPARQLEGAHHRFQHLGRDVTVEVRGGRTLFRGQAT